MKLASFEPDAKIKQYIRERNVSLVEAMTMVMESMDPTVMAKFYPRRYHDLGNFHSPKGVGAALSYATYWIRKDMFSHLPVAMKLIAPALKPLIDRKMPYLFLAPHFLEAIQKTEFQDEINWTSLNIPYEQGVFILPRKALIHPKDGEVSFILWSRVRKGNYPLPFTEMNVRIEYEAFSIVAFCPEEGIWYDTNLTRDFRPTLRLGDLFYREETGESYPELTHSSMDSPLEEGDADFLEKIGRVVFGTFLALNARPGLEEKARLVTTARKKNDPSFRLEYWQPNVIGRNYRPRREVPEGTHASPTMHWRRGHFRQQAYGPQLSLRKQLWIEPVLVGADGSES